MPPEMHSVAMPRRCAALRHAGEQGRDDARAGRADRVTEGDRTAVGIDPGGVERQLGETGERLRGERFVELDGFDGGEVEAVARQQRAASPAPVRCP